MSEAEKFEVAVDGVGLVRLPGTGPWAVREVGFRNYEICDSLNRTANPDVLRGLPGGGGGGSKWDVSVVFAAKSPMNVIVATANAALEAASK